MEPVVLGGLTELSRARIAGWVALVAALALLAYAGGSGSGTARDDELFQWDIAFFGAIFYVIVLGIALTLGKDVARDLLGFIRPASWPRALWLVVGGLIAVFVVGSILVAIGLDAGEEQGLVPKGWDSSRVAPFVANFVVIAVAAPIVEEIVFRGVGFAALRQLGGVPFAVAGTAVAFGLVHGLVVGLPILVFFGVVLAVLRAHTGSVYPPIVLHGVFNGLALILGVSGVDA
jgi:hypothetical protein